MLEEYYKAHVKEHSYFGLMGLSDFYGNSTVFHFYFSFSSVINIALKSILFLRKHNDTSVQGWFET